MAVIFLGIFIGRKRNLKRAAGGYIQREISPYAPTGPPIAPLVYQNPHTFNKAELEGNSAVAELPGRDIHEMLT
jgi:hypothetical protein